MSAIPAPRRPGRLRLLVLSAITAATVVPTSFVSAADPTTPGAGTQVVDARTIDVGATARHGAAGPLTTRAKQNAAAIATRPDTAHAPRTDHPGTTSGIAPRTTDDEPVLGVASVPSGISAFGFEAVRSQVRGPSEATIGMSGPHVVAGAANSIETSAVPSGKPELSWVPYEFFALPFNESYWETTVAWNIFRGRFLAVMPSFQDTCANGYLNLAVSTSGDPALPWTRFRIAMPDAWTDRVHIGFSDDKVVITTNEWDLDAGTSDCLGSPYEGSRIRVMDWTDLLDGGTLTVRDVSPAPATDYYSWIAAQSVPDTASNGAGNTVHLVGDRFAGTWGSLAYASITGSAKAGTAALIGNVNLTTARSMRPLVGPPARIVALPSGNGFMDEAPVTAVWRAGQLWLSANDNCTHDPDTVFRACARFIRLDTSTTPPTVSQDGDFGTFRVDTFHPLVGFSRDGTAYFTMSEASALFEGPIEQFVAYEPSGSAFSAVANEVKITRSPSSYGLSVWALVGSVVPDPLQFATAWQVTPRSISLGTATATMTRVRGGLTASPGGDVTIGSGSGWSTSPRLELHLSPSVTSPIQWTRTSASPTTEVTPGGPRLEFATDATSGPLSLLDLNDSHFGGTGGEGPHTVYAQWQTGDGTWSTPIARLVNIDLTPPSVTLPVSRFAVGATVGTGAPVRTTWTSSDALSGVGEVIATRFLQGGSSKSWHFTSAPWTSVIESVPFLKTYRYSVLSRDLAGNDSPEKTTAWFKPVLYQGTSSAIVNYKTWSTQTSSVYLGGSTRYATVAGSRATFTFSGRAAAIVSTKARTRGKAEVWVDGVKKATIDLYSSTTHYRQVVWETSWTTVGTHTVQLRVLGTSGRPRVDVDAFVKF